MPERPMPAGSEGVWAVRDPSGKVLGVSARTFELGGAGAALNDQVINADSLSQGRRVWRALLDAAVRDDGASGSYESEGYTLQRLPLATPEMIRVVEAARTMLSARTVAEKGQASLTLRDALSAFDHTGAAVVKQFLTTGDDAARAAGGKDG